MIVFEGIDGSGKTTQLEMAKDKLAAEGWPISVSRNLGGTPIGDELRRVMKSNLPRPETTNLYISVAIQEALTEAIRTQRQQGKLILMDRGPISLATYEIYGGKVDAGLVWPHVDDGMSRLKPDLVIIYRSDIAEALSRTEHQTANADYFEGQSADYFERVATGYEAAAKRYPETCAVIDGNRSIEAIHVDTIEAVRRVLERRAAS